MADVDTFSRIADVYDLLVGDNSRYYDSLFSSIRGRYPGLERAVVADIGGGTGLFTFHISGRVGEVLLADPSEAMLRAAKRKLAGHDNVRLVQGGLPDCGLGEDSIDVAVVIGTFQYLRREELLPSLLDIYKSLKPGGLVFIDLANFFALIKKYACPGVRVLEGKGLRVIEMSRHDVHPFREEWVHTYYLTVEDAGSGKVEAFESRHVLKMMSPNEMRLLLGRAGFSGIEVVPEADVDEEGAARMWCFAKKPSP